LNRSVSIPALGRRGFVAGASTAVALCGCDSQRGPDTGERWISAQGDDEDTYGLVIASADGRVRTLETGFRGHGVAVDPADPNRAVMVGRRPGEYGVVADLTGARVRHRFETVRHRRFGGHGCFTTDGSHFVTAELDVQTAEGTLAIRDARTFELVGEVPTYGIGPHELAPMPDGRTFVVGNGGILTRPETGADKLNLDTMQSTLTYVDLSSGAMVSEHLVAEAKASIRHLAVAEDGTVIAVMQVQRDALQDFEPRPLIAVQAPGGALKVLEDGLELGTVMHDYAGGVAFDERTRRAAVTSPRGNLVAFWDVDTGRLVGQVAFDDVSGVTVSKTEAHFVLSGSGGQVRCIDVDTLEDVSEARVRFEGIRWDNHLLAVSS